MLYATQALHSGATHWEFLSSKASEEDGTFGEDKESVHSNVVSRRVLVVDDLHDSARMLAALVREMGHSVEVAFSGFDAMAAVETFRPEIVLLDLGLPDVSGYEVCGWIRTHSKTKRIQVVAVSGYARPEDRQRSAAAGFDAHYAKPMDPAALEKLLKG